MLIYREDGWVAEVETVKDLSDKVWEKYELKVIRTIQESRIFKPVPDGTVFECCSRRDCKGMSGWSLGER